MQSDRTCNQTLNIKSNTHNMLLVRNKPGKQEHVIRHRTYKQPHASRFRTRDKFNGHQEKIK